MTLPGVCWEHLRTDQALFIALGRLGTEDAIAHRVALGPLDTQEFYEQGEAVTSPLLAEWRKEAARLLI